MVQRHVAAGRRVVEPPVRVFLDDDRPVAVALLLAALAVLLAFVGASQVPVPFPSCASFQRLVGPAACRPQRFAGGLRRGGGSSSWNQAVTRFPAVSAALAGAGQSGNALLRMATSGNGTG